MQRKKSICSFAFYLHLGVEIVSWVEIESEIGARFWHVQCNTCMHRDGRPEGCRIALQVENERDVAPRHFHSQIEFPEDQLCTAAEHADRDDRVSPKANVNSAHEFLISCMYTYSRCSICTKFAGMRLKIVAILMGV